MTIQAARLHAGDRVPLSTQREKQYDAEFEPSMFTGWLKCVDYRPLRWVSTTSWKLKPVFHGFSRGTMVRIDH